jgi:hypothetical protein
VVSDKKIFKISANENTLWTLAAMLALPREVSSANKRLKERNLSPISLM